MIKPHHIDEAYQWLCKQRRNHPDNADIWHLRFHWQVERSRILKSLHCGNYFFAPLQAITRADGLQWRRCVERGGVFRDIRQGLPRGCPLSPLPGAFFLTELDDTLEQQDVFYVRYMDDVLILSKRRWGLRKAIKRLNGIFSTRGLEQHPDKTFIGRIEKGFDFLGYHFSRKGLRLAGKTMTNALEKLPRLYEQRKTVPERAAALDDYLTRRVRWTTAGSNGRKVTLCVSFLALHYSQTKQGRAE